MSRDETQPDPEASETCLGDLLTLGEIDKILSTM